MKITTLEIQPDILRKILVDAISEGGEGLMDIDSDYVDDEAVEGLVDGIMDEVNKISFEKAVEWHDIALLQKKLYIIPKKF